MEKFSGTVLLVARPYARASRVWAAGIDGSGINPRRDLSSSATTTFVERTSAAQNPRAGTISTTLSPCGRRFPARLLCLATRSITRFVLNPSLVLGPLFIVRCLPSTTYSTTVDYNSISVAEHRSQSHDVWDSCPVRTFYSRHCRVEILMATAVLCTLIAVLPHYLMKRVPVTLETCHSSSSDVIDGHKGVMLVSPSLPAFLSADR